MVLDSTWGLNVYLSSLWTRNSDSFFVLVQNKLKTPSNLKKFHTFGWFGFNFSPPAFCVRERKSLYIRTFFVFIFQWKVFCGMISNIFSNGQTQRIYFPLCLLDYVTVWPAPKCIYEKKKESERATLTRGDTITQCKVRRGGLWY